MQRNRPLRVLTWHVHGNYLYYLTQTPHEFWLVTRPGNPPGHAGRTGVLPWGENVHEVDAATVSEREFDVVLYQHREHWERDRLTVLSEAQRKLPTLYLEHDPPQNNPFCERHWVDDPAVLIVHVTHFNRLMWDCGDVPTRVVEHGVRVPEGVRYTGELDRGIVRPFLSSVGDDGLRSRKLSRIGQCENVLRPRVRRNRVQLDRALCRLH